MSYGPGDDPSFIVFFSSTLPDVSSDLLPHPTRAATEITDTDGNAHVRLYGGQQYSDRDGAGGRKCAGG